MGKSMRYHITYDYKLKCMYLIDTYLRTVTRYFTFDAIKRHTEGWRG